MGFWSRIREEFIEIIEWVDEGRDTVVYKFPVHQEIKNNAKLVVREGQVAVFMYKGQIGDVYGPGTHSLSTDNMPVLSTLAGWKYGFESPFKADVYYVTTRQFSDMKWGTPQPIEIFDERFGPVRVRANGIYGIRVTDPAQLIRNLAGTDPNFDTEEISRTLREHMISNFTEVLVQGGWGVFQMKAKMTEIGKKVVEIAQESFKEFGIQVTAFKIRSITLPPAVQEAMDKSASMSMIGDMNRYQQYNMAEAIGDMGKQPGGMMGQMAAAGMGMGMGAMMPGMMGGMMPGMMRPGMGMPMPQPGYGYPQQQGYGYPQQQMPPQQMPPQQQPNAAPQPAQGQPQPQQAGGNPMQQQIQMIQQMLAQGQISQEQAAQMLQALGAGGQPQQPPQQ